MAAVNIAILAVGIAAAALWIAGLVKSDGGKSCTPEDCESCPFPPCSAEEKQKHWAQARKESDYNEH